MKIYNALFMGRWRAVTEQLPEPPEEVQTDG